MVAGGDVVANDLISHKREREIASRERARGAVFAENYGVSADLGLLK